MMLLIISIVHPYGIGEQRQQHRLSSSPLEGYSVLVSLSIRIASQVAVNDLSPVLSARAQSLVGGLVDVSVIDNTPDAS